MTRLSFRERVLQVREDAILVAVNKLLADKGFDLMTVDEVAAEVGIAKASLYKHFPSKEALAAAAMVRLMQRALAFIEQEQARPAGPVQHLESVVRWLLMLQLQGEMPTLPSQNSSLRAELLANKAYLDGLMQVSETLGEWITAAQAAGDIDPALPGEVVLYTIFARACDPVPGFLKAGDKFSDAQIVEFVLATCMNGLRGRG